MADHADIDKHVKVYILVFVSLMALTLITVGVSYLHLPVHLAIALALLVATIKGTLVACYFMHLLGEKQLIYVVMGFTAIFFFAVLMLPSMTQHNSFADHVGGADVAGQHEQRPAHGAEEGH